MEKVNLVSVGFLQAVGVVLYCFLVGALMRGVVGKFENTPGLLGMVFMLCLLVFSAAVTGSLVFGYPVYLALNKEIKKALSVLLYTLLFSLLIIVLIVGVMFAVGR